jgi:hypothetical protein
VPVSDNEEGASDECCCRLAEGDEVQSAAEAGRLRAAVGVVGAAGGEGTSTEIGAAIVSGGIGGGGGRNMEGRVAEGENGGAGGEEGGGDCGGGRGG